jgi:hypothetical protein
VAKDGAADLAGGLSVPGHPSRPSALALKVALQAEVIDAPTRHRENLAVNELAFVLSSAFDLEIFFFCKPVDRARCHF